MYYVNYDNIKKEKKTPMLFIIFGSVIILFFLSVYLYGVIKNSSYDSQVKADYVDYKERINSEGYLVYSPVYHFTADGNSYSCNSNVISNKMPKVNSVVYYNSSNPNNCLTDYMPKDHFFVILGLGVGALLFGMGLILIHSVNKNINKIRYLSKHGKLIRGIPYKMENTGLFHKGRKVLRITINYTKPDGSIIKLHGNPRYDGKTRDADGLVDLLIDPKNTNNYYIDFEIKYDKEAEVENYKFTNNDLKVTIDTSSIKKDT